MIVLFADKKSGGCVLEIIPIRMTSEELKKLASRTKVVINLIGPYSLYSAPIVEACAKNGTHYLDMYVYINAHRDIYLLSTGQKR